MQTQLHPPTHITSDQLELLYAHEVRRVAFQLAAERIGTLKLIGNIILEIREDGDYVFARRL